MFQFSERKAKKKSSIFSLFQADQQREMEGLLDNVRQLTRELRLQMLIIDSFIPPEYQAIIEENVAWNEDIGNVKQPNFEISR